MPQEAASGVEKEKSMEVAIRDGFIKLGQALKLAGLVENGAEAKERIQNGEVKVNGEVDTRRGRKCVPGDLIEMEGKSVTLICR
jgi:ribosome-associated protein